MESIKLKEVELTESDIEKILSVLHERFCKPKGLRLHEGIGWDLVKPALERDKVALWSLLQMENAGHEPDLYYEDDEYFYFGTCSLPSPLSARECVYDNETMPKFGISSEDVKNAVGEAADMGIELMPEGHYMILQESGMDFDQNGAPARPSSSYLSTPAEIRRRCKAVLGFRCDDGPHTMEIDAGTVSRKVGWRGYLKVKKVV